MNELKEHIYQIGSKDLLINSSGVYWKNKLLNSLIINPTEIRYGAAPIEFDMFSIGTKFRIDLRNNEGNTLTITIKSYLGIGRNRKFHQYNEIADILWDYFFAEKFDLLITKWTSGKTVQVGRFEIDSEGITRSSKKDSNNNLSMKFDETELLPRFDHLLINSKKDQKKYMRLYYLQEWNWPFIMEIINRAK